MCIRLKEDPEVSWDLKMGHQISHSWTLTACLPSAVQLLANFATLESNPSFNRSLWDMHGVSSISMEQKDSNASPERPWELTPVSSTLTTGLVSGNSLVLQRPWI